MKLKWFGHASYLLVSEGGTRIVIDPFNAEVGYRVPLDEADYVTVSHEHFDHNSVQNVPGTPTVLRGPGEHQAGDVRVLGIATDHDNAGGSKRGHNTVFCFDVPASAAAAGQQPAADTASIRVCHLGDLGHQLTEEQVAALAQVDMLLIPVGGTYTLDPVGAARQVRAIRPRVVVPMHYKTPALAFPLRPVEDFLAELVGVNVERPGVAAVTRSAAEVKAFAPSERPHVLVLEYVR
jgi:L-ascorbate metabolism protein UlaG (beta-lactamase superfamily)